MGWMDDFLNNIKVNGGRDDDADVTYLDDDDFHGNDSAAAGSNTPAVTGGNNERSIRLVNPPAPKAKRTSANGREICIIKPTSFDDSTEVIDTLLNNCPVVLNMEGLGPDIAQRVLDMVSGGTYAIQGKLQKIANSIFIITPNTVEISGDFQGILTEGY